MPVMSLFKTLLIHCLLWLCLCWHKVCGSQSRDIVDSRVTCAMWLNTIFTILFCA